MTTARPVSRYPRLELVALCAGSFVVVADASIVSIALPAIEADLGFSAGASQWVFNAYNLAVVAMLLPAGRAADVFGARRVYLAGLVLFGLASLAAGLATSPELLLLARVGQGLGGGAFLPAGLALVSGFGRDEAERNRAVGANGAAVSLGFVSGIVLGGALTDLFGWRSTLLIGLPLACGALALALASIPALPRPTRRVSLDVPGAIAGLVTVVALNLGVFLLALGGRSALVGAAALLTSALAAVALVRVERRAREPLIPLEVFRNRQLLAANAAVLLKGIGGFSSLYVLTYYYQDVRGASAWETSLLFLPMTATGILFALLAGRLTTRVGIRRLTLAGLVLFGGALAFVGRLPLEGTLVTLVVASMVSEVGYVLSEIPLTVAATSALPAERRGLGASLFNVSINIGSALGLTIVGALVALRAGDRSDDPETLAAALRLGIAAGVAGVVLAAAIVALRLRDAPDGSDEARAVAETEMARLSP